MKTALLILNIVFILCVVVSCHKGGTKLTPAIRMAADCSQSAVQRAIDSAANGDTISVPSGNCTWRSTVVIPAEETIILKGAGIDLTVITGGSVNMSGPSRITGFTFINGLIQVDGDGWRVDNCRFYNASQWRDGIFVYGQRERQHPTGLVDHCSFYNSRVLVVGWMGLAAHALWFQPHYFGMGNAVVYVEDCSFIGTVHSNAIDANYGGRYVFRHNTVTDTYVEAHSVQGYHRAARSWEIYNNTFTQVSRGMWVPIFLRGGTGVVFNNILSGAWTVSGIALDNVRDCENRDTSGKCDGSSPWDGNQAGGAGYPCRDQIGRGRDTDLWNAFNRYPPQTLDPAYAWNNKHNGVDVPFFQHNNCANHIQSGRDYFNNTMKPGYVPYKYPHPLTGAHPSLEDPL